jgi:hypothetical protein
MTQRQVAAIFGRILCLGFSDRAPILEPASGFVVIKPFFCQVQIFDDFSKNPRRSGDSILNKIRGLPLV